MSQQQSQWTSWIKRTENLIQRRCNISNFRNWIMKYITKCDSCWRNKIQRDKQYNEVIQIDVLSKSWKSVTMNFIMKLSSSKEFSMKNTIQ
jgi:hypothetical protein